MDYTYLKARAKINVALDVLSKRDDGYHELKMIMQTLQLHDGLFLKKIERDSLRLVCNLKWMPTDERNLVYAAVKFMMDEYALKQGVFVELTKNIPVSAGLGGGSSDCAAALIGIRRLFNLPISNSELSKIGLRFGADVPFCLMRGTALAEGIGEKLTRLPAHPDAIVLLAKPPVSVSTASIFKALKVAEINRHPNIDRMIEYINKKDLAGIASEMGNVLEGVTGSKHNCIYELKNIMLEAHALNALMSGSGPTVFGYFQCSEHAYAAISRIKEKLPHIKDIFLTSIYTPMPIIKRDGNKKW